MATESVAARRKTPLWPGVAALVLILVWFPWFFVVVGISDAITDEATHAVFLTTEIVSTVLVATPFLIAGGLSIYSVVTSGFTLRNTAGIIALWIFLWLAAYATYVFATS